MQVGCEQPGICKLYVFYIFSPYHFVCEQQHYVRLFESAICSHAQAAAAAAALSERGNGCATSECDSFICVLCVQLTGASFLLHC